MEGIIQAIALVIVVVTIGSCGAYRMKLDHIETMERIKVDCPKERKP